ncbi:uncharacterized protein STEHIDRAFT_123546, partial [Stereum hirsutum FP-91666 SS1]|uniref:uncharacterized protein n=1 Tax=Stereum hirsutum (strain FP-91666) TaxID=721885 RepID=UPI000444A04A
MDHQPSKFHPSLNRDAAFILKSFAVDETTKQSREALLTRLNKTIGAEYDGRFSVDDYSFHKYGQDIYGPPLELYIVDTKYEHGLTPDVDLDDLPLMYDPSWVASLLLRAGFNGTFPMPNFPHRASQLSATETITQPLVLPDPGIPWPSYPPIPFKPPHPPSQKS